jgi:hypothetical protein
MFIPPIRGVWPGVVGTEMWQGMLLWRQVALDLSQSRSIRSTSCAISRVSAFVVEE